MRHPQARFNKTTEHLLDTAERLVIETGIRSLSLESVSIAGFASIGSVYERWRSKWHLVDQLLEQRFESHWHRLTSGDDQLALSDRLQRFLETSNGHLVGTWLVELLHLGRVRQQSAPNAIAAVRRLVDWLEVSDDPPEPSESEGLSTWLVATALGIHQLRMGQAAMPGLARAMITLIRSPSFDRPPGRPGDPLEDIPGTSPPPLVHSDEVSRHIVGVTRALLAKAVGELSVRSIIDQSNVSSTTLYRRFESKRQLLLGVLDEELRKAEYHWVLELVDSLRTDDPIGAMARVFRNRFDTLTTDPDTRNVILELTNRARTDDDLRSTLIGQVERMAHLRSDLFDRLRTAGVVRQSLSPEVAGWLVQAPATGYRLLVGAGIHVDPDRVENATSRILWNLLAD